LANMIWTPRRERSSGVRDLTVAWVPTGMKAGVSTHPRAVCILPSRVLVSCDLWRISKEKGIVVGASGLWGITGTSYQINMASP
jgi:hypothetical protein